MRCIPTIVPVLLLATWPAVAWADNVSIRRTGDEPLERCDQLQFSFDDAPAQRAEQRVSVPLAEARTLRVSTPRHGGVHVLGVDGSTYSILACKGVPADANRAQLEQVTVAATAGELAIDGPAGGRWIVYLIIQAPRSAGLDLDATNGPLSVQDIGGDVRIRSRNGPIALSECSGRVDVNSQNGPIKYQGRAGDVSISAQNGPLSVLLTSDEWKGTLNARTQNGPVKLAVPTTFKTGLQVESSKHAPWKCAAAACGAGKRSWDDNKLAFTMGTGAPTVRLATVNGPVAIGDSSSRARD
jgi:hypothetical protein